MAVPPPPPSSHGFARIYAWRRVRFVLFFTLPLALLLGLGWKSGFPSLLIRVVGLGMIGLTVFGVLERWPPRLPSGMARWALQVAGIVIVHPFAVFAIYVLTTKHGAPHFWLDKDRMSGFATLTGIGMFLGPWFALAALVSQKDQLARHQALAFDLERSELGRQAVDARLRLLQAQVSPHFLFNTLANVQALVDAGSPQASAVLRSLVAYLRAAVPRLHEQTTTLAQELDLAKAYLELMHMRMPDRLAFAIEVDEAARGLRCPPMTLLTLVENAVRHGIDPSEDGGRIEVRVERRDARCRITVTDTGLGLAHASNGLGTGLSTLRERLQLSFHGDASLTLSAIEPHGARAEAEFPAESAA